MGAIIHQKILLILTCSLICTAAKYYLQLEKAVEQIKTDRYSGTEIPLLYSIQRQFTHTVLELYKYIVIMKKAPPFLANFSVTPSSSSSSAVSITPLCNTESQHVFTSLYMISANSLYGNTSLRALPFLYKGALA